MCVKDWKRMRVARCRSSCAAAAAAAAAADEEEIIRER
jgi:hypothetical protein